MEEGFSLLDNDLKELEKKNDILFNLNKQTNKQTNEPFTPVHYIGLVLWRNVTLP